MQLAVIGQIDGEWSCLAMPKRMAVERNFDSRPAAPRLCLYSAESSVLSVVLRLLSAVLRPPNVELVTDCTELIA